MSDWQIARHHVSIAGRVLDAGTGKPVAHALVYMSGEVPKAFDTKLGITALSYADRWHTTLKRPDRTITRTDGIFYFLDLPDGKYELRAGVPDLEKLFRDLPEGDNKLRAPIPSYGKRFGVAQATVTIPHGGQGTQRVPFVSLALPATTVKGKVTGAGRKAGVVLAEVRVEGSGERTFTDVQGQYVITGIEPGKRVLVVSAQGYRDKTQSVTLANPGASQPLDFTLTRESG
jgi:hypothetical protein